jgi:hypothetical protein
VAILAGNVHTQEHRLRQCQTADGRDSGQEHMPRPAKTGGEGNHGAPLYHQKIGKLVPAAIELLCNEVVLAGQVNLRVLDLKVLPLGNAVRARFTARFQ